MPYSLAAAEDMWSFEDHFRRVSSTLFDTSLPQARQNRNRIYREALLQLHDGLRNENVFDVREGVSKLWSVFVEIEPIMPTPEDK